ncbi:MAG: hypothetical protein IJH79_09925 [Lentisphaeria bacterium]|nr:hypothetical protein [Lentisphaeria bacterium]
MKSVRRKTAQEHREFVEKTIRLEMFYAHLRHREAPEESPQFILRERIDIVRYTTHYRLGMENGTVYAEDPGYRELEAGIAELLLKHENDADSEAFENEVSRYLKPELDANNQTNYRDSLYIEPECRSGFMHYDPKRRDDEFSGWMAFHIANDRMPHSFFDDPQHIRRSFEGILDAAENLVKVDTIFCCSWLNSFPPWLALFPEEWTLERGPEYPSVLWHLGFWGQFINARGLFNDRYAEMFRKTGKMPFAFRCAHCKVDAMRKKLASMNG